MCAEIVPHNYNPRSAIIPLLRDALSTLLDGHTSVHKQMRASFELRRCVHRLEKFHARLDDDTVRESAEVCAATSTFHVYAEHRTQYYEVLVDVLSRSAGSKQILQNVLYCCPFFCSPHDVSEGKPETRARRALLTALSAEITDVYTRVLILECLINWCKYGMQLLQDMSVSLLSMLGELSRNTHSGRQQDSGHMWANTHPQHTQVPVCVLKRIYRLLGRVVMDASRGARNKKERKAIGAAIVPLIKALCVGIQSDRGVVRSLAPQLLQRLFNECPGERMSITKGCVTYLQDQHSIATGELSAISARSVLLARLRTCRVLARILSSSNALNEINKASLQAWTDERFSDDSILAYEAFSTFDAIVDRMIGPHAKIDTSEKFKRKQEFVIKPFLEISIARRYITSLHGDPVTVKRLRLLVLRLWIKVIILLDFHDALSSPANMKCMLCLFTTCLASSDPSVLPLRFQLSDWLLKSLAARRSISATEKIYVGDVSTGNGLSISDTTCTDLIAARPILSALAMPRNRCNPINKPHTTAHHSKAASSVNTMCRSTTAANTRSTDLSLSGSNARVDVDGEGDSFVKPTVSSAVFSASPCRECDCPFAYDLIPLLVSGVRAAFQLNQGSHMHETADIAEAASTARFPECLHRLMCYLHRGRTSADARTRQVAYDSETSLCKMKKEMQSNRYLRLRWTVAMVTSLVSSHHRGYTSTCDEGMESFPAGSLAADSTVPLNADIRTPAVPHTHSTPHHCNPAQSHAHAQLHAHQSRGTTHCHECINQCKVSWQQEHVAAAAQCMRTFLASIPSNDTAVLGGGQRRMSHTDPSAPASFTRARVVDGELTHGVQYTYNDIGGGNTMATQAQLNLCLPPHLRVYNHMNPQRPSKAVHADSVMCEQSSTGMSVMSRNLRQTTQDTPRSTPPFADTSTRAPDSTPSTIYAIAHSYPLNPVEEQEPGIANAKKTPQAPKDQNQKINAPSRIRTNMILAQTPSLVDMTPSKKCISAGAEHREFDGDSGRQRVPPTYKDIPRQQIHKKNSTLESSRLFVGTSAYEETLIARELSHLVCTLHSYSASITSMQCIFGAIRKQTSKRVHAEIEGVNRTLDTSVLNNLRKKGGKSNTHLTRK
ncbi:hypothetical protein SARC_10130 [Sphaeroforma arctica JP610]|uniref:Uncharacterized protein n=1 Tax=Sphaeroforma arctica JP610 TaxID=667725 RepID=A0A0L0FKV8_9EUKA|nr:hypothetical protein SARC_10130 [Sphaeroforma arctica JP610]KNC77410.1 hypothetical protein SARC_10130 [Sphaeroforma arctica JP610]|eukprot:XP_014151312.1 hypothetical protein SARC_10130 [Sphaeroforma arctica JP610]